MRSQRVDVQTSLSAGASFWMVLTKKGARSKISFAESEFLGEMSMKKNKFEKHAI